MRERVCLSVWKILSYTSQYFCPLFLSFTPSGGLKRILWYRIWENNFPSLCPGPFENKTTDYEERYLIFKKAANCMISRFLIRFFFYIVHHEKNDSCFKNWNFHVSYLNICGSCHTISYLGHDLANREPILSNTGPQIFMIKGQTLYCGLGRGPHVET
jgi:hypothetical protein